MPLRTHSMRTRSMVSMTGPPIPTIRESMKALDAALAQWRKEKRNLSPIASRTRSKISK